MNCKEWWNQCNKDKSILNFAYYNSTKELQRSLLYNSDQNATIIHHLRDTEEQRKYNDEHYELWSFNLDGTFEYGKYVIFVTHEEHTNIHAHLYETRSKISESLNNYWTIEKRAEWSKKMSGNGNPFYGKHHSQETKEKLSGENNGMYGKHLSEQARKAISEANKNKVVSEETRKKLSLAVSGEKNGMYGKHPSEESLNKMRNSTGVELQKKASIAYRKYKEDGGDMKWQDFRRKFMKEHRTNSAVYVV